MIFQDCGGRPDLLRSLRRAGNVIVPQHVQGKPSQPVPPTYLNTWQARLMSDMVAKDRPHARQISMPSGKILRHLGQVNSGMASIDTNRQRVRFPSAAG